MLLFSSFWLLLVYAPICHWVWGGGWLGAMGLQDFAGGAVVHITAGAAALVAAMSLGGRRGFGQTAMPPHNLTMTVTGAGMLWVGWFGFNAGSAVAADSSAAMAMLVTHLSAACGALAWMTMEWIPARQAVGAGDCDRDGSGAGHYYAGIGLCGTGRCRCDWTDGHGVVCYFATIALKNRLKIDDSLDVFSCTRGGGHARLVHRRVFSAHRLLGLFSGNGFSDGVSDIAGQLGIPAHRNRGYLCLYRDRELVVASIGRSIGLFARRSGGRDRGPRYCAPR